ncbi:MAG: cell division protein SepF [Phascolarctobacterium sp.]|uniref:cell division protein SepF n=1 Tax=Phascolarctobacterium sp. TaxID=2049039 RepID=UPI0026DBD62C|nr:cell division protein SepF [Phascolarctobacterium sp.]MDO4922147.1 cell division protein SepF [Phascolarctobacterium sp.]
MNLKNTAIKFFSSAEEEERVEEYAGPRLLKTGHLNIMVRAPKSFTDVREYADSLMSGSAILVSFEAVDAALRNRIFDYLNGVSYIVAASVSFISDDLLLYAPEQVEVNKEKGVKRTGMRSWLG